MVPWRAGGVWTGTWRSLLRLLMRLEQHHPGSLLHARQVAGSTRLLARQVGLPLDRADRFYFAGLFHDVGKLSVPSVLLNRPGPLQGAEEWAAVRQHVLAGCALLSPFPPLRPVLAACFLHHERWDGSGYPLGLRGVEIPLLARIVAIADVFSAMTEIRPYRKPLSREAVSQHLWLQAGRQFDAELVHAFLQVMNGAMPMQDRYDGP